MTLADRLQSIALIAATLIVSQLPAAYAQSAEAEVLFREGRKLIKAGKLAAGCDKLVASEKLESSVGTLLNLGDCRDKLGKTASAWAAFRKAEAMAKRLGGDDKRQGEARKRAEKLEPSLATLLIQVDRRLDGLTIKRDGIVIDAGAFNTAVPVDPGSYAIEAEAPGFKPWHSEITVLYKSKRTITVPPLDRLPAPRPTPVAATPVVPALPARASARLPEAANASPAQERVMISAETQTPSAWTPARKLGLGVAVVGAGAIGAGIYFGTRAQDLRGQADARCPLTLCADPEGLRLNSSAQTSATRANIFYVAGGVAMASSIVLMIVGGPEKRTVVTPSLGAGQAGASITGRF